ncbi:small integral membrane protein 13 [Glossina fuscipes]|uniref:Small integral membrane protein 13 n=1 Tax=Glossina fuscipes TaxID=7396 RepID=A0A8U0W2R2_9MUSC|nr:small integral membrane protein 13 [Glossina fuscipes]
MIMSVATTLALIFTVFASICIVAAIILLGWFLIWKTFLSKFRLVRELLGHSNSEESEPTVGESNLSSAAQSHLKARKLRKD